MTIAADYDSFWDTPTITNAFTQVGDIAVKSHLQNALFGPRVYFSTHWTDEHHLNPFGEAQFGVSYFNQKLIQVNTPSEGQSRLRLVLGIRYTIGGARNTLIKKADDLRQGRISGARTVSLGLRTSSSGWHRSSFLVRGMSNRPEV